MAKMTARFRAYLQDRKLPESGASCLAGVDELRRVVRWANSVPESEHDNMTPEDIIRRYRKEGGL